MELLQMLHSERPLIKNNLIQLSPAESGEPFSASALSLTGEAYGYITTGKYLSPSFSSKFPTKRIQTAKEWNDIVLNNSTQEQIKDIIDWLECIDISD